MHIVFGEHVSYVQSPTKMLKYITFSSVLVSNGNFLVNDIQCKGTDVRITGANSRNLLRNVSSSRYKFNAERRLRVNRMQLQQQCACVCVCQDVCKM